MTVDLPINNSERVYTEGSQNNKIELTNGMQKITYTEDEDDLYNPDIGETRKTNNNDDDDDDINTTINELNINDEKNEINKRIELAPPENFSMVLGEIYRSSFPRVENFQFLKKLKLKSILILIPEKYPEENLKFIKDNNIKVFQVGMSGNKEPFVNVPHNVITEALKITINPENHPLLIHCNRGKHRTGCLVGCLRRLQNWSLTMIFDEYRRFASPKARPLDQQLIELYDETEIYEKVDHTNWLPLKW